MAEQISASQPVCNAHGVTSTRATLKKENQHDKTPACLPGIYPHAAKAKAPANRSYAKHFKKAPKKRCQAARRHIISSHVYSVSKDL